MHEEMKTVGNINTRQKSKILQQQILNQCITHCYEAGPLEQTAI